MQKPDKKNQRIKKAFFTAILGTGAVFGVAGGFIAGKAATDEYLTHRHEFNEAKKCVAEVEVGGTCTPEQYKWAALYGGNKKDYGLGLSWLFGGASFVRIAMPRLRKDQAGARGKKAEP